MTAGGSARTASPRVALVTGAGQRVGRVIAEALAAADWSVAVHFHRSRAGADEVVAAVRARGGHAQAFAADLATSEAPDALVREVHAHFGRLDLLCASAAGMVRSPLPDVSAAAFDAIIALNLRAPFLLAQAASRVMLEGGVIVHIADHMAEEPWPGYAVHGIAKAGVIAMTRHLAAALAPKVRVNAVAPGFVLAPEGSDAATAERFARETPLQRIGAPRDVAEAVLFLATAGYMTGEVLFVDGGRRVRR